MAYYTFNFKFANTSTIKQYSVEKNITVKNFIEDIKNRITNDFNINDNENIEIIEAGQENDELASVLLSSEIPLKQIYENKHTVTSFYIRKTVN
jgi:hypothetical protein